MSWLYSIVVAGLLLSSGQDTSSRRQPALQALTAAPAVPRQDETERFEQTYPLAANGRVNVSNVNGSITVEAWDRKEVHLVVTKIADSKETLAEVEVHIDAQPDSFSAEVDYAGWKNKGDGEWKRGRRVEVEFKLSVPRGAVLNEIQTVNGSVTVSNFTNSTKVSAVNGNVSATNLRGAAKLATVNGEVTADFERLETGTTVSLSTVNGRVNLTIPSDANATLRADSLNGNITNDFGLPVKKGEYVGRDLYGRVGTGDVRIKLNSVNGPLTINRKNDGKSISPSVNLLPQKGQDDEDWDDDSDDDSDDEAAFSKADREKLKREMVHASKEAKRHTAAAMKDAQREIVKIKPALEGIKIEQMSDLKIKIDNEKIREQVREGVLRQKEALERMNEIGWSGAPIVEKKAGSLDVKGVPTVTVDAKNCSVTVRGWDKSQVKYLATRMSPKLLKGLDVAEERAGDSIVIKVTNPEDDFRRGFFKDIATGHVEVFVPRKSNLKIVSDREIRLDGVSGNIDLDGGDSSVNVRDSEGSLSVATVDGEIRVIGFKGDIKTETSDADVFLEGEFRRVAGKSSDGNITLTLPENASARLVSNTPIDAQGFALVEEGDGRWRLGKGGPDYSFDFSEGSLIVRSASVLEAN
jgi:hypothetical protein